MKKATVRLMLQIVYDLFRRTEGIWPTIADLQQELNHRGHDAVVAVRIVRQIDAVLLKPLDFSNGHPAPTEQLILTAEAIKLCANSTEDLANLLVAVKWLARRMEQLQATVNQSEHGMRFTPQQLAEAIPVGLNSAALHQLVTILQAEGWIHDDRAI